MAVNRLTFFWKTPSVSHLNNISLCMHWSFSKQRAWSFQHQGIKLLFRSSAVLHSGKLKLISEELPEITVKFVALDVWQHACWLEHGLKHTCVPFSLDVGATALSLIIFHLCLPSYSRCSALVATRFPSERQHYESAYIWSSSVIIHALWSIAQLVL